jgi:nucleotide-binding universal stress UspA family protein
MGSSGRSFLMSTQEQTVGQRRGLDERGTILVGVDDSESNKAAVDWAFAEAKDARQKIVLVGACARFTAPMPEAMGDYTIQSDYEADVRQSLRELTDRLEGEVHEVSIQVASGAAPNVLLSAAEEGADLLVVGQRGMGPVKRLLVGSTSIAVAGRSPIPVVVVPDSWDPLDSPTGPIVVGIDAPVRESEATAKPLSAELEFAFKRAARLSVPLVVVTAWQLPALLAWSPAEIGLGADQCQALLRETLQPWRETYPEVEVETHSVATHPVDAILDVAKTARMVVLGRHTSRHHLGGFTLGSTARGVLHYAECPVAVVPTSGNDEHGAVRSNRSEIFAPTF